MGYETSRDYFDREMRLGGRLAVQYESATMPGGVKVTIVAGAEGSSDSIDRLMGRDLLWTWDTRDEHFHYHIFKSWGQAEQWVRTGALPADPTPTPDAHGEE